MRSERQRGSARDGFWAGVTAADEVLTRPSLEREWGSASVLPELATGALTAHLVRAVATLVTYASSATEPAEGQGVSAAEYFVATGDGVGRRPHPVGGGPDPRRGSGRPASHDSPGRQPWDVLQVF